MNKNLKILLGVIFYPYGIYLIYKYFTSKKVSDTNNKNLTNYKNKGREQLIDKFKSSSFIFKKKKLQEFTNISDVFENLNVIRNYSHHISSNIVKDWVDGNLKDNNDYKEMNDFYSKSTGNNFPIQEQVIDDNELKEKNGCIHYPYSINNLNKLGKKFKHNDWKVDEVLNDFVRILESNKEQVGDKQIIDDELIKDDNLLFVTPYSIVSEKWVIERQVSVELSLENVLKSGENRRNNYKFSKWDCPNSVTGVTLQPMYLEMIYKYSYIYFCNKFYLKPISNFLKDIDIENRIKKVKTKIQNISFDNDKQMTDLLRFSRFIEEMNFEIENHIERLWSGGGLNYSKSKKIDDFSTTYQIFPDSILKLNYHYGPSPSVLENLDLEEIQDFYESLNLEMKLNGQFFVEQLTYFQNKLFTINYLIQCFEIMTNLTEEKLDVEYRTLYLSLEGLNIFESSIEIQKLNELKEINEGMLKINSSLLKINNNIVKGFEDLKLGLNKISGQISYNNLLTTVNTYQLYKINKKLNY